MNETTKTREKYVRREAKLRGYLLRRSRTQDVLAEDFGLYVLVGDTSGNRWPGAQAPKSAFARGEGQTLEGISAELEHL